MKAFGAEDARAGAPWRDRRGLARQGAEAWYKATNSWIWQNLTLLRCRRGCLASWCGSGGRAAPAAGDAVFAITSFFLDDRVSAHSRRERSHLQKGIADIEDVVAYSHQERRHQGRAGSAGVCPGSRRHRVRRRDVRRTKASPIRSTGFLAGDRAGRNCCAGRAYGLGQVDVREAGAASLRCRTPAPFASMDRTCGT